MHPGLDWRWWCALSKGAARPTVARRVELVLPGVSPLTSLSFPFHFLDSMLLWDFPLVFLIGSHVPYGCRVEQMLWKPWYSSG